jgi:hypothetical protein
VYGVCRVATALYSPIHATCAARGGKQGGSGGAHAGADKADPDKLAQLVRKQEALRYQRGTLPPSSAIANGDFPCPKRHYWYPWSHLLVPCFHSLYAAVGNGAKGTSSGAKGGTSSGGARNDGLSVSRDGHHRDASLGWRRW